MTQANSEQKSQFKNNASVFVNKSSEQQLINQEHQRQEKGNEGDDKQNKNEEQQINYYNEFCRLYLTNTILTAQLKELSTEKNELVNKLTRIQKRAQQLSEGNSGQVDEKKKRIRRSASQIARHYKCQVEGCNKSYGSQGSLNQHLKIKHPQIFRAINNNYLMGNNATVKQSQQENESL